MKILLKLKHWHLFLLFFLSITIPDDTLTKQIGVVFAFSIYLSWVYSIGIIAHQQLPKEHHLRINYFHICFIFSIFSLILMTYIVENDYFIIQQSNIDIEYQNVYWLILIFQFYTIWSILYLYYLSAKILSSAIEGRIVGFDKSSNYFFAFWFLPIGIWYVQPKVEKFFFGNQKLNTEN